MRRFHRLTPDTSGLLVAAAHAACADGPTASPTPPAARHADLVLQSTAQDCQAEIDAARLLTETAPITGKNADVIQKLGDFVAKVEQLEAAGKLDAASADQLSAGANDAIACIQALGA